MVSTGPKKSHIPYKTPYFSFWFHFFLKLINKNYFSCAPETEIMKLLWTRFCSLWDFFSVKSWCVLHINIQIWFMWSYRHVFDFLLVNYAIRIKFPRDHPYITSAKGLGGSRKWPVSLTFSTVFMLIRWVGGVQKGKKYDVI